ncbi:MAG: hypothetical protein IT562_25710 [Alphaproteobacteria bacterium]|nr:hypothetical protein [Alphaproteobacteria bacterium]
MYQRDFMAGSAGRLDDIGGAAPMTASFDPRYVTAREAARRSFFNRYGRMPTELDIDQTVAQFLSPVTRVALGIEAGASNAANLFGSVPTSSAGPIDATSDPAMRGTPQTYVDAAERAVQSFHNRFGRPPTEEELQQSIGHFLPGGEGALAMNGEAVAPASPGDSGSNGGTAGPYTQSINQGMVDAVGDASKQVADAGPSLPKLPTPPFAKPAYALLEPRGVNASESFKTLEVALGNGRYAGWMSLTNEDSSWSGSAITPSKEREST